MKGYRPASGDKQIARISAYMLGYDPATRGGAWTGAGMTGDQA